MSDNSRSRVTVTLGRSGRVIKSGADFPDDGFSNEPSMPGRKRSVRDRLGSDAFDRNEDYNKRHRGDSSMTSRLTDMHLDKHDLRFRLMQKSMAGKSNNNGSLTNFDLRDKLLSKASRNSAQTKTVAPLEATVSRQRHDPEHTDMGVTVTRRPVLDPRDTVRDASMVDRFPSRNTSDLSLLDTGRTYSSLNMSSLQRRSPDRLLHSTTSRRFSHERNREEYRRSSPERLSHPSTTRRLPPDCRDEYRRSPPERLMHPSTRRLPPESRDGYRSCSPKRLLNPSTSRRISPERSRGELRRSSPERFMHPSTRRLSPERLREELHRRPTIRAYDDGRSSSLRISPPRPASSAYLTRSLMPDATMRSVAPLSSHYPHTSGIIPKIPSMGVEQLTVESFLFSLGLEKFAIIFKAEEIDMNSLRQLGDEDLKDLGIPMGPRRKILQSMIPRYRRLP